ncbi:hypothetical protein ABKN59_002348 [Abortiporus biennis]
MRASFALKSENLLRFGCATLILNLTSRTIPSILGLSCRAAQRPAGGLHFYHVSVETILIDIRYIHLYRLPRHTFGGIHIGHRNCHHGLLKSLCSSTSHRDPNANNVFGASYVSWGS